MTAARLLCLALILAVVSCGGGGGPPPPPPPPPPAGVDLVIDEEALRASLRPGWTGAPEDPVPVVPATVDFGTGSCAEQEGLIGGPGVRRIARFATTIWNRGDVDLHLGDPAAPAAPWTTADFHFDTCHDHTHFVAEWVDYRLVDDTDTLVGFGHKQGFCIEDALDPAGRPIPGPLRPHHCGNMGITAGHGDIYPSHVPGQWIDVTGVPAGDYWLEVIVNPTADPRFGETVESLGNNVARLRIRIPE